MSAAASLKYITEEEYLAAEEISLEKHEYYKGEVFVMAGASFTHNDLVRDTLISIGNFLEDKPCRIYPSDMRIHITANTLHTYPDLSIFCEPVLAYKKRTDTATNPSVIIEVLSPSTEDYDRGGKFKLYREISSLKEYILISSTQILIEKYSYQSDGEWKFNEYKKGEDILTIQSIDFKISLTTIYRKVKF